MHVRIFSFVYSSMLILLKVWFQYVMDLKGSDLLLARLSGKFEVS